jgi:DNA primase
LTSAAWKPGGGPMHPAACIMKFTVRTAPALLKKDNPWVDYAKAAKPLRAAIERLIKSKS